MALHGKVAPDDYAALDYVYRTKEEVRTMLVATLDQERKKIYKAGVTEGEVKGQQETLLKFITWRFQPTSAESAQITEQLGKIANPQQLTRLTERFLQSATLAEFMIVLAETRPPATASRKQK